MGSCQPQEEYYAEFIKEYKNLRQLKGALDRSKGFFNNSKISYTIKNESSGKVSILINILNKKVVKKIILSSSGSIDFSKFNLPENRGFFSKQDVESVMNSLKTFLETNGYVRSEIVKEERIIDKEVHVYFLINEGERKIFFKARRLSGRKFLQQISSRFEKFKNKAWDRSRFEVELASIKDYYEKEGFYFFNIKIEKIEEKRGGLITPVLEIIWGPRNSFDIKGNENIFRNEILEEIKDQMTGFEDQINEDKIEKLVSELYERKNFYNTRVNIRKEIVFEIFMGKKIERRYYFVNIKEGDRLKIRKIEFIGSDKKNNKNLKKIFSEKGSDLIQRSLFDKGYIDNFTNILKRYYLGRGFVFVKIIPPIVTNLKNKKSVDIFYRIIEGQKVFWRVIEITGIPKKLRGVAFDNIKNSKGTVVNLSELGRDLEKIEDNLKKSGYFFVKITNKNSPKIMRYSNDNTSASLNIEVSLGQLTKFDSLVVVGLKNTDPFVIKREVFFKKNEIITPLKIQKIYKNLSKLRIFNSVSISVIPVNRTEKANILISVREKKFGFLELAPGFRSDIGLKFSTKLGYNNLFGLNHIMTLKSQVNQRLDFDSFDERKKGSSNLVEFDSSLRYDWPYFLSKPFDMYGLVSFSRRRFRYFDDDIIRGSLTFNKSWMDFFSMTVRYQIENNRQFNAVDADESKIFSVGSVRPGFTFDFRNSPVNPSSGVFVNFSAEFARPYFASKDGAYDISYNKLISRNAGYLPLSKELILAISIATGLQQNLEKDQPIPTVKVFRLNGIDRLRGFSSVEANRIDVDGRSVNIEEVDIDKRVYFLNLKFEPRYYFSDTFIAAPFFDAGQVSKDRSGLLDLRASTGVSFKIVTPVGVLNFDYGVKLKRRGFSESGKPKKESFGQFHFTLGAF